MRRNVANLAVILTRADRRRVCVCVCEIEREALLADEEKIELATATVVLVSAGKPLGCACDLFSRSSFWYYQQGCSARV